MSDPASQADLDAMEEKRREVEHRIMSAAGIPPCPNRARKEYVHGERCDAIAAVLARRERREVSDERIDAIEKALAMKPGDGFEGAVLLRKDVSNGVFGWWLAGGGFVSLNNIIAKMRPDKTGPRTRLTEAERLVGRLFVNTKHFSGCICVTCEDTRAFLSPTLPPPDETKG